MFSILMPRISLGGLQWKHTALVSLLRDKAIHSMEGCDATPSSSLLHPCASGHSVRVRTFVVQAHVVLSELAQRTHDAQPQLLHKRFADTASLVSECFTIPICTVADIDKMQKLTSYVAVRYCVGICSNFSFYVLYSALQSLSFVRSQLCTTSTLTIPG
jgi:hypothetical protein